MKIEYKSSLEQSFLVISELAADSISRPNITFELRMLKNQPLPSLLMSGSEQIDGETCFLYDISSLQSFEKTFETERLSFSLLCLLLSTLDSLFDSLTEYLLSSNNVFIRTDCIFINPAHDRFYFCYVPTHSESAQEQLRSLSNQLLSLIDYNDQLAVALAFGINRAVQADYFTIKDLYKLSLTMSAENYLQDSYNTESRFQTGSAPRSGYPDDPIESDQTPESVAEAGGYDEHNGHQKSINHDNHINPSWRDNITDRSNHDDRTGSSGSSRGNDLNSKGETSSLFKLREDSQYKTPKARFKDKARAYFDGKGFSEVFDDINSGKILRKIRETKP